MSVKANRAQLVLNVLAIALLFFTLGMIFFYAPVEATMGNVQRLFYFHVGSAWVGAGITLQVPKPTTRA